MEQLAEARRLTKAECYAELRRRYDGSLYSPVLNNPVFDLQGRRLGAKSRKGIYIENGRKQVVK